MNRSNSRGRLIETAFVSSSRSSTEDLDEVDRLANHPVLRSSSRISGVLRKSRSEMGCRLNSTGVTSTSWQFCPSSPVSDARPPTRGMTRTITFHANLSAVLTSHTDTLSKSAPSTPPTRTVESRGSPVASIAQSNTTPPNTAPLPNKFQRLPSSSERTPLLRFPLSFASRFRQRVSAASVDSSSTESSPQRLKIHPSRRHSSSHFHHTPQEDSSSSAMSSTESVTDASSEVEISGHRNRKNHHLTILSPISDKSQEGHENNENEAVKNANYNNQLNDNNLNNNNNSVESVPWDMPKLRRRLLQKKSRSGLVGEKPSYSSIQGSDSGISMTSTDLKDLLNVPWDMPKLRRKTSSSNFPDRPLSLPNDNAAPSTSHPSIPTAVGRKTNLNLLNKGGREKGATESLCLEPPPGFEDEFYLTETTPQHLRKVNSLTECSNSRPRPKMTLSFGVDPSKKTLMFSTNSPFDLIDCDDVNPNIPLNRQDWYHGGISKEDAEKTLKNLCEGSYLVRNLDYSSSRQEYALSLKSSRGYIHMRIKRDPDSREFSLSNFPKKFITIPQMIHHYSVNRLPIKGAEHMCLKKPVSIQLL